MRCKSKPGLEDEGDNACPVEEEAHLHFHHHVMKSYMVDDKRKGVHQCKNEKGIGDPSVKHLELLMRNTGKKCDPARLRGSRTVQKN